MNQNYFSPLLFFIFFISLQGFSQGSLQGLVVTKNQDPVAFANVVLLEKESETFYRGTVTDETGAFRFENILNREYLLRVSFVGYKDLETSVNVSGDTNLSSIVLAEDTAGLDEVTIRVKNPTVTRAIDRLVFNVENSTLSSGNSWDILKKTPGVVVSQDQLLVRNNVAAIYINDRKVQLTATELRELLESYSAANIKSVEVITNPPAKYEAEGGAILNIITSGNITPGYKGNVHGNFTQAVFPKYNIGTGHYFKSEKLDVFANYSFSPRKEFKRDDSHINFINEEGEIFSRWNTDFQRTTRSQAHNANLVLDYDINDRNALSFSTNLMYSPNKNFDNRVFTDIRDRQFRPDSTFVTDSRLDSDQYNLAMDLTYVHELKKEGASLSLGTHYTGYGQDREQLIETEYFSPQGTLLNRNRFSTDANQNIDIITGQLDYVTPLAGSEFEAGARVSFISSESGIDYFDRQGGTPQLIDAFSDNFLYDEYIYAAYSSFSKDWESWSFKAGLRGEYTDITGISNSLGEVNTQEYFRLFPTFYLRHELSEDHSLTLDYSRRIARPRYESLNPFRYFLNENNFNAGNPDLRAAISNNYNLNYTLKGQYFFDLYYRDNGRNPETLSFQDNVNLNIRQLSVNLLESRSYGIDFSHGRSITGFWYFYAYLSAFHEENTFLAVESDAASAKIEVDGWLGSFYNSLTLSKDGSFTGELTFLYISDFISGSYNWDPVATLSVGLRKTLWNNRAELSLNVNDILDQTNTRLTSRYLNQDNSFFAQEEMRYVRLGFKYNFGNFRLRDNQRVIDAAERERI